MSGSPESPSFDEDTLVERPAIALFAELGWRTPTGVAETFGAQGSLGRETRSDTVLWPLLRRALAQLNPGLPVEALEAAVQEVSREPAVMEGIRRLLHESIAADPFRVASPAQPLYGQIDLSKIDFAALSWRFERNRPTNTDLEHLRAAVGAQLERMVLRNPTRTDYLETFRRLVDAYNAGSRNIEEIFRELVALSQVLTEEQTRHVRENLSEEELTIFDILTRPAPDLGADERAEVKQVASVLLHRLHALLVLGWRQKVAVRAKVRLAIEDLLDDGLPRAYSKELYADKVDAVFDHVYRSYAGDGASVFAGGRT